MLFCLIVKVLFGEPKVYERYLDVILVHQVQHHVLGLKVVVCVSHLVELLYA